MTDLKSHLAGKSARLRPILGQVGPKRPPMFPAWLRPKKALTVSDLFPICSCLVFAGPLLRVERREGRGTSHFLKNNLQGICQKNQRGIENRRISFCFDRGASFLQM